MSSVTLTKQLQDNLLRVWMGVARTTAPGADFDRIETAFRRRMAQPNRVLEGLSFSDTSEESRAVERVFPNGLPGLDLLREPLDEAVPRDLSALAASMIIGTSAGIRQAIETALRLARTSVPVLITGETGVGKDLFAQLIHQSSRVARGPCVAVNCAALPESLVMSELFGYEPGAFTGAVPRGREGKVEAADGGTLFLDEIAELPLTGQAALLRFLDTGEVAKIGRVKPRHVIVRIVCATRSNLDTMVRNGQFREDLYYRIALVPLRIPPLRERTEDIPLLVEHFLSEFHRRHRRIHAVRVDRSTLRNLTEQKWPGNVRELMFLLERAFVLSRDHVIRWEDIAPAVGEGRPTSSSSSEALSQRLREARAGLFRNVERWQRFLEEHAGREFSTGDVARTFDVSEATARVRLVALVNLGVLEARGLKKGRRYRLAAAYTTDS